jgi:tetratricopeptide (TPR) repeat protein
MAKLYEKYITVAEQLSLSQQEKLHEVTLGIPIVIKHCYARYFEFSDSFNYVMNTTGRYEDEIIQFSFKEILQQIETADENRVQLRVILLLELISYPLMTRQISDILNVDVQIIDLCIPSLIDFQCLSRTPAEGMEKYEINPEIRLLTRALAQKHSELSSKIRNNILSSYTVDKQLDYSDAELQLVGLYNNYLSEQNFLEAENFIKDQITKNPDSIVLKYYYARYQKNYKRDAINALKLLESIREKSRNHPEILMLLIECYVDLSIPNFEQASVYANELTGIEDEDLKIRLAEFYVRWSTAMKMKRFDDPFEERARQSKYKDLAGHALSILQDVKSRTHHVYYLLAQSQFNLWDYVSAARLINKAIETAEKQGDFTQSTYYYFRNTINNKSNFYKHQSLTH